MRFLSFLLVLCLTLPALAQEVQQIDSDGDGIFDILEDANNDGFMDEGETDPFNADTDDGGEADGAEVSAGRDPLDKNDDVTFDRDGDTVPTGREEAMGTDPDNPDTDDDGVDDANDPFPLEQEYRADEDQDGMPDEFEEKYGFSSDKRSDNIEDADGDGLSNQEEFILGTNPLDPDTDSDGTADGIEIEEGSEPLENACLYYAGPVAPFADTQGHWANIFISRMQRTKILPDAVRLTEGYEINGERRFAPNQPISRFELLKLALLSGCITLAEDYERISVSFTDLPSTARPREDPGKTLRRRVVYTAVREGIVEGYEDGSFRPDAPVNRAEALKILLATTKLEALPEVVVPQFADVDTDAWFAQYVNRALRYDIISGYKDPSSGSGQVALFKPENQITRAEAAKLIYLLMLINPHVNGYELPAQGIE